MCRRPPRTTMTDTSLPSPPRLRSSADGLEADVGDRIAGRLVRDDLLVDPQREVGVGPVDVVGQPGLERRRREVGGDAIIFRLREVGVQRQEMLKRLLDLTAERSEEHTSELQSLMRISYAVFCLHKKKQTTYILSRPNIHIKY